MSDDKKLSALQRQDAALGRQMDQLNASRPDGWFDKVVDLAQERFAVSDQIDALGGRPVSRIDPDLDQTQQQIAERQALLGGLHERIDEDDDLTPGERDVLRTRASKVAGQIRTLRGAP